MCWMWLSAVFAEMNNRSEISRVLLSRRSAAGPAPRGRSGRRHRRPWVEVVEGPRARSIWCRAYARCPRRSIVRPVAAKRSRPPDRAARRAGHEIGERRHVVGAAPLRGPLRRAAFGRLLGGRALEQGRQAGQRDHQLGHGAGADEGLDRGAKRLRASPAGRRRCARGRRRGTGRPRRNARRAHEVERRPRPSPDGALRVRLRVGQPHDPERVREPVRVARSRAAEIDASVRAAPPRRVRGLQRVDVRGDPVGLRAKAARRRHE